MITFEISLDPDQEWQNIGPVLGEIPLTLKKLTEIIFWKSQQRTIKAWKITQHAKI